MADFLKKPLGGSLNDLAIQRAADALHRSGKSLPCSVVSVPRSGIVTIKFEVNADPFTLPQITIPVFMSRYVRLPLQAGDKGACIAADARLGGVTGLGAGTADLTQPGNLSALMFCPLGSTAWTAVDLNAVVLTAPNGFLAQTDDAATSIKGDSSGLVLKGPKLGFFGSTGAPKAAVTGALSAVTDANAKAVLTSLLAALTGYGEITNGTT